MELGEFEKAESYLNSSIQYATGEKQISKPVTDSVFYNYGIAVRTKGFLYQRMGKYTASNELLKESYRAFQRSNTHWELHNIHGTMAGNYVMLGQLDTADYFFNLAFETLGFDTISNYIIEPKNFGDELLIFLKDYATLQEKRFEQTNEIAYLKKMAKILSDAYEIIDYRISNLSGIESMVNFLDRYASVTEKAMTTNIRLYELTNDEQYLYAALEKSDRNKSRIMLQNLHMKEASIYSDGQEMIHSRLKLLYEDHRLTYNKIKEEADTDKVKQLEEKLLAIKSDINRHEFELKKTNKIYRAINANSDYRALISSLDDGELALHYTLTENKLFRFEFTNNTLTYSALPINAAFQHSLKTVTEQLQKSLPGNQNSITELSDVLLQNIQWSDNIKHVVVIPDGLISYIPFEVLIQEDKPLIDNFAISYSSSFRLLSEQQEKQYKHPKQIACFAPNYNSRADQVSYDSQNDKLAVAELVRDGEYELPGAIEESKAVHELFNGDLYLNADANEQNFRSASDKYGIVHLAMHALANEANPMESKLVLSRDKAEAGEDNLLHAYELYKLDLKADLAVLSACNTGVGKINKGDGVQSLSQAFIGAGVGSTVHSLWKVPDNATKYIMIDFYKNLKEGNRKDEALRMAKLNYRNDETIPTSQKAPYYWAGFVASGNMCPLPSHNMNYSILIGILASLLLLSYILFTRRQALTTLPH